jgi:hypothetical protein
MEANQLLNSYDVPEGVIEKLEKKGYTRRIDLPRTDNTSPWNIKEECELSGPEINMLMNGIFPSENGDFLKCMILDQFFPEKDIPATHILGLKNPQSFMLVGLNYANDRYDERNGC